MSLSSTTSRVSYTGNGSVDTYSYTFKVFDEDDLLVTVRDTSDVQTTLTKTTDYTVTGVGATAGGTIVLVNSAQAWLDVDGDLKTGYVLVIRRKLQIKQETDIRNADSYYPEVIEDQFDSLVMIDQQQQDEIDRSVKLPESVSSASFDPTLPSDILDSADRVPMMNPAGNGFAAVAEWPTGTAIAGANADALAAAASAAAALVSETNAATSETNAATSEANALTAETNAETAETNAAASAAAASASASSASTSASTATTQAGNAATSAANAATAETNAETAETNAAASAAAASTSASNASTSATNAGTSETNAAASAASAASAVASAFYRDVVYKTSADSPITLVSGDNGKLFVFDASGGAISVTLPQISSITPPYNVAFLMKTAGNTVTVNRAGTDTIMGATSKSLSTASVGFQLVADTGATPDDWSAMDFGAVADGSVNKTKMDSSTTSSSLELSNLSLACSVGSNALTIALKDKSGSDASASSPITIGFRDSTSGTGTYLTRQVTSSLSVVVSSGSTLGHKNGLAQYIYVYAIDTGSGVVLGASSVPFDEGSVQSTTAEGGAGAADSVRLIYSTAAQTSKPIRLIGRLLSSQTTAGTWAAVPTEIAVVPFEIPPISLHYYGSTTSVTTGTDTVVKHTTKDHDPYNLYDTSTGEVLIPLTGKYLVSHAYGFAGAWGSATNGMQIAIAINGAGENIVANSMAFSTSSGNRVVTKSAPIQLTAGDLIRQVVNQGSGSTTTGNTQQPMISVVYLGR